MAKLEDRSEQTGMPLILKRLHQPECPCQRLFFISSLVAQAPGGGAK
jgi:hypothetical protein